MAGTDLGFQMNSSSKIAEVDSFIDSLLASQPNAQDAEEPMDAIKMEEERRGGPNTEKGVEEGAQKTSNQAGGLMVSPSIDRLPVVADRNACNRRSLDAEAAEHLDSSMCEPEKATTECDPAQLGSQGAAAIAVTTPVHDVGNSLELRGSTASVTIGSRIAGEDLTKSEGRPHEGTPHAYIPSRIGEVIDEEEERLPAKEDEDIRESPGTADGAQEDEIARKELPKELDQQLGGPEDGNGYQESQASEKGKEETRYQHGKIHASTGHTERIHETETSGEAAGAGTVQKTRSTSSRTRKKRKGGEFTSLSAHKKDVEDAVKIDSRADYVKDGEGVQGQQEDGGSGEEQNPSSKSRTDKHSASNNSVSSSQSHGNRSMNRKTRLRSISSESPQDLEAIESQQGMASTTRTKGTVRRRGTSGRHGRGGRNKSTTKRSNERQKKQAATLDYGQEKEAEAAKRPGHGTARTRAIAAKQSGRGKRGRR